MFYKYLPPEEHFNNLKEIKILSFSYTELIDEPSILHSHSNCEVIIPLNNYGSFKTINKITPLAEGQIIVVNNNVMHTEINDLKRTKDNLKYFAIRLGLEISKNSKDYFVIKDINYYNEIIHYLNKAYELLSIDNEDSLGILNLSCCYYLLLSYFEKNNYSVKSIDRKIIPDYIIKARSYLSNNYNHNFSLSQLAESLTISQNLLTLRFKEVYGITPKKYLISVRLNMAKHMLSTSNYSVSQISFMCGFKSPAYFTHVFVEEFNMLPKEFRKRAN